MPQDPLRISSRLTLPADELQFDYARSGGPGGQNVNKVETKVVLRFSVQDSRTLSAAQRERLLDRCKSRLTQSGDLVIRASRYRERRRNVEDARERLAELLRSSLATPRARRATRPTRSSVRRRLDDKRKRGETKRRRREDHG